MRVGAPLAVNEVVSHAEGVPLLQALPEEEANPLEEGELDWLIRGVKEGLDEALAEKDALSDCAPEAELVWDPVTVRVGAPLAVKEVVAHADCVPLWQALPVAEANPLEEGERDSLPLAEKEGDCEGAPVWEPDPEAALDAVALTVVEALLENVVDPVGDRESTPLAENVGDPDAERDSAPLPVTLAVLLAEGLAIVDNDAAAEAEMETLAEAQALADEE